MAALRRNFLVDEFKAVLRLADIDTAISVQARRSLEETHWLLGCAGQSDAICGVVGWAPLLTEGLPSALDQFADNPKLVGIREIVQAEPEGFLDQSSFDRGVAELTRRDLAYDLLIRDRQLQEATCLVDRHPRQRFVLDHSAKPPIGNAQLDPWRNEIASLAKRQNVFCKLSGLVTEAIWSGWTLSHLRPYLDVCVEAFGPERLMAGSDWPVCLVASTYPRWWSTLSEYFSPFSEPEIESIFGGTAAAFYKPALVPRSTNEA